MQITAILPISRTKYLDRVITSLINQTYKPHSLLVVYDGPDSDYLAVRNKIVGLDFAQVLCVQSNNKSVAFSIPDRRRHIVSIHNQLRGLIGDADWVFSIEDDGVLQPDSLDRLVNVAQYHQDAGMVTGVELGRWGVPYVGAWVVDDMNDVQVITSIENKTLQALPFAVQEIDACGLYCALIRADYYKQHEFFTDNGLGPDVNLGLFLRQNGFKNYIDWGVSVTHLTDRDGDEIEIHATSSAKVVRLTRLSGDRWQSTLLTEAEYSYTIII